MGKNEFMSPKDIGNRIKAKGLQKLRWYCQMCQKQCRDENGFKCHCASEGHLRMMQILGEDPNKHVDEFSQTFLKTFLEHIKMTHRFTRVQATVAYNEYIADRHHTHMNSTRWTTLTEFVKYLGREGLCEVDETPKGWFIKYVDRDPFEALKNAKTLKRAKHDKDDEERRVREVEEQAARAAEAAGHEEEVKATELVRGENESLGFKMASSRKVVAEMALGGAAKKKPRLGAFDEKEEGAGEGSRGGGGGAGGRGGGGGGALESIFKEEEAKKERQNRRDYWLHEGIVVKVMSKDLKEAGYYKAKGVVQRVHDRYVGQICINGSGDVLKVDQAQLETVLPQPGGAVLIVNGAYRGERATLSGVDVDKFKAKVKVAGGQFRGREVLLDYEDVCKLDK